MMADPLVLQELLGMPDHLRRTFQTVSVLHIATADQVALQTKRARAVESHYLNQLAHEGKVIRERIGRTVYFHVPKEKQHDDGKWNDLFAQARRLPYELQRILVDDLLVAFQNRLNVLIKATA
jgi:hypothetical protein